MSDSLMDRFQLMQMQKSLQDRSGKLIKLRWNTPTQVRRSLSRVCNMLANNQISPKTANSIYANANLILRSLELEKQNDKSVQKCAQKKEKENET